MKEITYENGHFEKLVRDAWLGGCKETMPAIAEKGGLERLVVDAIDGIANELCNLLEERDRQEGKSDNPPEIEEQFWTCPKCGSVMYDTTGSGTQRVWRCGSCLHEEKKAEEG